MEKIYFLLAKHFSNQATPEEDLQIEAYRENNHNEYQMLQRLWQRGKIDLHDFDTESAWKKLREQTRRSGRAVPFYRFRRIAAAVAVLLITSISAYYISREFRGPEQIVAENMTGSPLEIMLEDGSSVWLKQGAQLVYNEKFRGERAVELSGTAFFDITKDRSQPFVVTTPNSRVTVLGTSFNIKTGPDKTEVTVQSGIVEVLSAAGDEKVVVRRNQTAIVSRNELRSMESADPNYLAWKNGVFTFSNTAIQQVVKDLNTYYSNRLELDTTQQYDCNLTASFNKTALEDVLQIIETTCALTITKTEIRYKIY